MTFGLPLRMRRVRCAIFESSEQVSALVDELRAKLDLGIFSMVAEAA